MRLVFIPLSHTSGPSCCAGMLPDPRPAFPSLDLQQKPAINLHNSECLLLLKPLNRGYPGKSISVSPPRSHGVSVLTDFPVVFLRAAINPDTLTAAELPEHPHSSPSEKKKHVRNWLWDHNRVFPLLELEKKEKK